MKMSKSTKLSVAFVMSFLMTNVPNVLMAEELAAKNEMISTGAVLEDMTRVEAEKNIRDYLESSEIRNELVSRGVSPDEASARLANLSEQEIKQLSIQVKEARAGGDILITILVIVLIIYLIRRI